MVPVTDPKDMNIACRIPWATWDALNQIRASRQLTGNRNTSLSDVIREALDNYVGDTWQTKKKH